MKGRLVWSIFWAQVAVFVLVVVMMFTVHRIHSPFGPFLAWIVFFCLGAILLFLTLKAGAPGKQGKFMLLTGAAAVGFIVFGLLHNLVSGLLNVEEPVFFILAVIVCPVGFLVGAVGNIVLGVRNRIHKQLIPGN